VNTEKGDLTLKPSLSISNVQLEAAREFLRNLITEFKTTAAAATPTQNQNPGHAPQPAPASAATPAPLNEANLERNTQAFNKMHQRTSSKSGHPPAAPTTTQPPFSFGAQKSPIGQPTYFNKPAVTQETLIAPPARKKAKTGLGAGPQSQSQPQQAQQPQQISSPAVVQPGPSPQVKQESPELKRQVQAEPAKPPPRPLLVCPDSKCEMHKTGFPNQQALDAHHQEEHVKPYEDPEKYSFESLADAIGLDTQGLTEHKAPRMAPSASKQSQTSAGKMDLDSTPMSKTASASMRRQGSATGGRANNTPKAAAAKAIPLVEDPWAHSTVDPNMLVATFSPLAAMQFGGSFGQYRSVTPLHDTPESTGNDTNPTSDISDRARLDIDINCSPAEAGDADLDLDFFLGRQRLGSDDSGQLPDTTSNIFWEDQAHAYNSKNMELDASLYSLAC
jgi:hypothetical protein